MNLNLAFAITKIVSLLFFSLFFSVGGYFLGKKFTKKEDTERQLISNYLNSTVTATLPTSINGVPIQVASLPDPTCKYMMPCGLCQLRKTDNGFEKCTLCKEVKNDSLQSHKRQNRQRTDI